MTESRTTSTRLATLGWNDEGVLVIRFRPEVPADVAGVTELVAARVGMTKGIKARVMVVLDEGMDFEDPGADERQQQGFRTLHAR